MKAVCGKLTFFSSALQQEGPSTSTYKHNQKEASDMRVGDSPLGSQAVTKNWIDILWFFMVGYPTTSLASLLLGTNFVWVSLMREGSSYKSKRLQQKNQKDRTPSLVLVGCNNSVLADTHVV
jgi:hypothetical protein